MDGLELYATSNTGRAAHGVSVTHFSHHLLLGRILPLSQSLLGYHLRLRSLGSLLLLLNDLLLGRLEVRGCHCEVPFLGNIEILQTQASHGILRLLMEDIRR